MAVLEANKDASEMGMGRAGAALAPGELCSPNSPSTSPGADRVIMLGFMHVFKAPHT